MIPSTEHLTKTAQKNVEDINDFAKQSWEVAQQSMQAMIKGCDETARSANGLMQESIARAVTASKQIFSAKSLREMMDLQAEFMKDHMDHLMAGTGKITEISARVTKETLGPVTKHANDAFSKILHKQSAA